MARPPAGPQGNTPRDKRDDFVGEPADEIKTGLPPRWPPNPRKITKNTFHAKVSGRNAAARADRAPHFRKGGFVAPPEAEKKAAGGHISTAERKALPSSEFALPGQGKGASGKGPGSYPIDTPARARNALARGAQHASPAQLATIKRKVKSKYPSIGQKDD